MMLNHDMSTEVALVVTDDCGGSTTFAIRSGPDGVEIYDITKSRLEASDREVLSVVGEHCDSCLGDHGLHELLGLTKDERDKLVRWRTRKQDGIPSRDLAEILDKIVKALQESPDAGECDRFDGGSEITLRVGPR